MKKSIILIILLVLFTLASSASVSISERLDKIETLVYGQKRLNEPLDSRISRLETIIFGKNYNENNLESRLTRLEKPFDFNEAAFTLPEKLDFLEWKLQNRISRIPNLAKASRIKKLTLGTGALKDPLIFETDNLLAVMLNGGEIIKKDIYITNEIEIKASLKDRISSRYNRRGDPIELELLSSINKNNVIAFPAGSKIVGSLSYARKAGLFGRNGRIKIKLKYIYGFGNKRYNLRLNQMALGEKKQDKVAAGITILGVAALGPVGAVSGFFVRGKDIYLHPDTEFILKIQIPNMIKGFVKDNSLTDNK